MVYKPQKIKLTIIESLNFVDWRIKNHFSKILPSYLADKINEDYCLVDYLLKIMQLIDSKYKI